MILSLVLGDDPENEKGGSESIRTWKLALAFCLIALGVSVFLMLQLPDSHASTPTDSVRTAGEPQTGATYVNTSEPANDCSGCHPSEWDGWATTKHAWAYPDLMNATGDSPALQFCEACHNTGTGKPSIYPATGYDPVTNGPAYLQNVTCQTCHGPASNHIAAPLNPAAKRENISLVLNASLCGSCHAAGNISSTHHPTYDEWQISGHNTSESLPSYVKSNPECANCHEAWNAIQHVETGTFRTEIRQSGEDAPLTWEISCSVCHDPHSLGSAGNQLRVPADQLCQRCHTQEDAEPGMAVHHPQAEVRNNTAGYLADRAGLDYMSTVACSKCHMAENNAGLPNHTFVPNPYSCVTCHGAPEFPDNATAQAYIDDVAARTVSNVTAVQPLVDQALAMVRQMAGNRSDVLSTYRVEYNISKFNLDTVISDKSNGNHNPGLTSALLSDSRVRAISVVENLTPPEKITGVVAIDAGGGKINVSWTESTATDFAKYRIYVLRTSKSNITSDTWSYEVTDKATTTYTVEGKAAGTYYVYVTAVDTNGNEITNTLSPTAVSLAEEERGGGGLSNTVLAGIVALVVAAVVVAAVLMMRKKRKGSEPSEVTERREE